MIKSALQSSLTNDIKYRSMSAGAVPSSEYLIQTIEVGATTLSAIEFTNLSQYSGTFRHLVIYFTARTGRPVGDNDALKITLNGTTPTVWHALYRAFGSLFSSGTASETNVLFPGGISCTGSTAGSFGAGSIDILDAFSTTKNKTIRCFGGHATSGTSGIGIGSTFLNSTSALNTIKLENRNEPGNFLTGSRFSIYGVTA